MPTQFHVSGRVTHLDASGHSAALRTKTEKTLRLLAFSIVAPLFALALVTVKLGLSLMRNLMGVQRTKRTPGLFSSYLTHVAARSTAGRLQSVSNITITNVRIRDSTGQVIPVRAEGHFQSGALAHGDNVVFLCRLINGVNVLKGGRNNTTGEMIRLTS